MIYYRVRAVYDQAPKLKILKTGCSEKVGIFVASELYTKKELEKHIAKNIIVPRAYFEKVNISKRKIYFLFGARFS